MKRFHVTILSSFPEMFPGPLGHSLAKQGLEKGLWEYEVINIRDFGVTKHKNFDDTPAGGGNGLIMRPDVLGRAIDYAKNLKKEAKLFYPSPRGKFFTQDWAHDILDQKNVIFLCGRFEGIDERIIEKYQPEQISIGDYVLSGGEVALIVILDTIIRLIPGVIVNHETLDEESFNLDDAGNRLLEYPLYTKPRVWEGMEVPEVLLTGHHAKIRTWRQEKAFEFTKRYRPDLLTGGTVRKNTSGA